MEFKIKILFGLSLLLNVLLVSIFVYKVYNNWFELDVLKSPFRESIFAAAPNDTGKIYFVGDSDIEAFELNEFLDNKDVRNRGVWGDVSSNVLKRISSVVKHKPSKLFLKIGQNDICSGIKIEKIKSNVEGIIAISLASTSSTKFFIISELPTEKHILHSKETGISKISQLNEAYKTLANKYKVTYIDAYSHFIQGDSLKKELYHDDYAHLNGKGYLLLANLLKPYLNEN